MGLSDFLLHSVLKNLNILMQRSLYSFMVKYFLPFHSETSLKNYLVFIIHTFYPLPNSNIWQSWFSSKIHFILT